jgi:sugar phosphate isomerase/epimerase
MALDRRTFIKSTVTSGAAIMMASQKTEGRIAAPGLTIKILATNWGFEGTMEEFCAKAKLAGYDGIEIVFPTDDKARDEMMTAVKKHSLEYAFLVQSGDSDYTVHLREFEKKVSAAAATRPLHINCHAGRDWFSSEQNKPFIDFTTKLHQETKVPIYHETHRSRILYSTPVAKGYLDKIPDLRVTLDISHWCAVHETLLSDQSEAVELALKRTDHIHARIGHQEGPQVNDPRAPEWKAAVEAHLAWWDKVVSYKVASGAPFLTFLTEFGPIDYMPAMPYTRQPIANQWEINVYMLGLLRKRYTG